MMSEKPSVDAGDLEQAKSGLSHVETKTGAASAKPVFKCDSCGATQEIPQDVLEKMEADEDVSGSIPDHCGSKMKISVVTG
jgi:hypothetical protein